MSKCEISPPSDRGRSGYEITVLYLIHIVLSVFSSSSNASTYFHIETPCLIITLLILKKRYLGKESSYRWRVSMSPNNKNKINFKKNNNKGRYRGAKDWKLNLLHSFQSLTVFPKWRINTTVV